MCFAANRDDYVTLLSSEQLETCHQCYPHLSTRSPSGTRCIGGIKVSPSRNNQCHCVTPCYQDVMLVWRRVTRSYRRAAQCDVWHSGSVMCDTVARCEHVSRDQDTPASFVTSAATHPRQPATVASGEYIFVGQNIFSADFIRKKTGKHTVCFLRAP